MMHGYIPPHRFFPYLTWTDIDTMPNRANVVIVQPIGAIEQHGPHLPLIVDAAIATAVVGKALSQLDPNIPAYSLPPLYYGKSNEHWHFPGTITLSAQTLIQMLMEVGESLYRAGFRKFALINGHGGQPQIMEIVARDLHQKYDDFLVFPLFVWRVPNLPFQDLPPKELEYGIHAGEIETSVLLSLLPEQVRMDQAVAEYPPELPEESVLSMEGALPFAWTTRDLSRSGVLGDPLPATVEKGDRILNAAVESWVCVLKDLHRFRQPQV
ncbi:creatininase family protein [Leptolyngbya sp. PL-A3]|nr:MULTISPECIES: creatininase family protein [unclassified Leptolyngbya]